MLDSDGQRVRQVKSIAGVASTVWYDNTRLDLNSALEEESKAGQTTWRHTLSAGGHAFAVLESGASNSLKYLHADHQGSIVAASDSSGNLLERLRYDPWGQRNDGTAHTVTTRGYTALEMLDSLVGSDNPNTHYHRWASQIQPNASDYARCRAISHLK